MSERHRARTVCAVCGEDWPCTEEQVARFAQQADAARWNACFTCGGKVGAPYLRTTNRLYHAGRSHPRCLADALSYVLVNGWHLWRDRYGNIAITLPEHHDDGCEGDRLTVGCRRCIALSRRGSSPMGRAEAP